MSWWNSIPAAPTAAAGALNPAMALAAASAGQGIINTAVDLNQARINRQFQLDMSSTAYQRAVADMRAAGINPMVAYQQGGASTGSGAMAKGSVDLSSGLSSALNYKLAAQEQDNRNRVADATVNEAESRADKNRIDAQLSLEEFNGYRGITAGLDTARTRQAEATTGNITADTALKLLEPGRIKADIALKRSSAGAADASTAESSSRAFLNAAQEKLTNYKLPEAKMWADFVNTIAPFAGAVGRAVNVIGDKLDKMTGQQIHDAIGTFLKSKETTDAAAAWNSVRNFITDTQHTADLNQTLRTFLKARQSWSRP